MALWHKRANPIDRSVRDVERQIAALERQIHSVETGSSRPRPAPLRREAPAARSVSDQLAGFFRQMVAPPKRTVPVTYKSQTELFDLAGEPLRELEAEPIAFGQQPDLFQAGAAATEAPTATGSAAAPARGPDKSAANDPRLVHYLSVGSIRTYRPLRRVQREARNRFIMWVGLSLLVFWLIYVVVR